MRTIFALAAMVACSSALRINEESEEFLSTTVKLAQDSNKTSNGTQSEVICIYVGQNNCVRLEDLVVESSEPADPLPTNDGKCSLALDTDVR